MARSLRSFRQVATMRHGHMARRSASLRFAPAFRALGVCEHIWLRYKNFDPSCFDPIQKFGMSTWGLTLIFDPVPSTYFRPPGYVPISSSAPRPLGAAYILILLSEVEQEQRPSGNGDREAIVVGAGVCDGEGERAYTGYTPHIIRNVSAKVFSLKRFGIYFCRNVHRHVFAETSGIRKYRVL